MDSHEWNDLREWVAAADDLCERVAALDAEKAAVKPTEFRKDGWPLCPLCGEDEVASPLMWTGDADRPTLEEFLASRLRCMWCGWDAEKPPE